MLYKNELFFHIFELGEEGLFVLGNLFLSFVVGQPLGCPSLLVDLFRVLVGLLLYHILGMVQVGAQLLNRVRIQILVFESKCCNTKPVL